MARVGLVCIQHAALRVPSEVWDYTNSGHAHKKETETAGELPRGRLSSCHDGLRIMTWRIMADTGMATSAERAVMATASATIVASASAARTVTLGFGHLGVTLSNHPLGVSVVRAHEPDAVFQAGLRAGDVIIAVDGTTVFDHEAACDLLGSNIDKPIVLHGGPQAAHQVSFLRAAVAEQMVQERFGSPLGLLRQFVTGAPKHTLKEPSKETEVPNTVLNGGTDQSLLILVLSVGLGVLYYLFKDASLPAFLAADGFES